MLRNSLQTKKTEGEQAATNSGFHTLPAIRGFRVGDFPLGSSESRAAARMQLLRFEASRCRIQIFHRVPHPRQDNEKPHAAGWVECQDGTLMRWIYVPAGMTRTEALRQLGGGG